MTVWVVFLRSPRTFELGDIVDGVSAFTTEADADTYAAACAELRGTSDGIAVYELDVLNTARELVEALGLEADA